MLKTSGIILAISVATLVLAANVSVVHAQTFTPPIYMELSGSTPRNLLAADINHDSNLDLIVPVAGATDGSVSILIGDGLGGFEDGSVKVPFLTNDATVGDFDGDANLDLAVVTRGAPGDDPSVPGYDNVRIYLGDGQGNFVEHPAGHSRSDGGSSGNAVVTADFDQDGTLDLAVGTSRTPSGGSISIHLGLGDGLFEDGVRVPSSVNLSVSDLELGDFNEDGLVDLVCPQGLFSNDPSAPGTFALGGGGGATNFATVGDLDDDGNLDIVTGISNGTIFRPPSLNFWRGNGDGSLAFSTQLDHIVGEGVRDTFIANVDSNLIPDLVVTRSGTNEVQVFPGLGNGDLGVPLTLSLARPPGVVTVGDWNGDGAMDIATAVTIPDSSGELTILLNTSPTTCGAIDTDDDTIGDLCDNCTVVSNPNQRDTDGDGYGNLCDADFNNDGGVNNLDVGAFLLLYLTVATDTGSPSDHADLNGDGGVNNLDFGIFLNSYLRTPGPSCCGLP